MRTNADSKCNLEKITDTILEIILQILKTSLFISLLLRVFCTFRYSDFATYNILFIILNMIFTYIN